MAFDPRAVPSPFYRVALKAIILDEQERLLVVQAPDGLWEIPGGGWEYDEDMNACLKRELTEELGADAINIGQICFMYRGRNPRGYQALRVAVQVRLRSTNITHGQDMLAARFVRRDELADLPMADDEVPIKEQSHKIW